MNSPPTPSAQSPLQAVYDCLDKTLPTDSFVCRPGCAACCTSQTAVFSVEGKNILDHLKKTGNRELLEKFLSVPKDRRFAPNATFNQLARMCLEQKEPPAEPDYEPAPCPVLDAETCPIYPVRPLACRVLLSRARCDRKGYADMDEATLTIIQVFTQFVEHLDFLEGKNTGEPSRYGGMSQMLESLDSGLPGENFLPSRPIPGLLVPPGHQKQITPIATALQTILRRAAKGE